jgi:hypothetical protein
MGDTHQPGLFPARRSEEIKTNVRVVWVFRRDSAELRVAHGEDERLLVVARPDEPVMQRRFASVEALVEFQMELEAGLRRDGWALHHVEPDRRNRIDRRSRPRGEADRRRSGRF